MVKVIQLIGPYAGQPIEMEYAVAEACIAAGTAQHVDETARVKGIGTIETGGERETDPKARGEMQTSPGDGHFRTGSGDLSEATKIDVWEPYLGLPTLPEAPKDARALTLSKQEVEGMQALFVHDWPEVLTISAEMMETGDAYVDIEGEALHLTFANGEATYHLDGVVPFFGVNEIVHQAVIASLIASELDEVESDEDDDAKDEDPIPAEWGDDWKSIHHMQRKAVAKKISGDEGASYSSAQANAIIEEHLAKRANG